MALIFLDSFEHYSTAQSNRKWNIGSMNSVDPSNGRTGNGASFGTFGNPTRTFTPEQQTVCVGYAVRYNTLSGFVGPTCVWGSQPAVNVAPEGDGRLVITASTSGWSSSYVLPFVVGTGTWFYIELWVSLTVIQDDSSHYHVHYDTAVHVNEAATGTFSVDSPIVGGSGFVGRGFSMLYAQGAGGSFNTSMDDVYVTDGEFLGDIRIGILYPNAAGDASDWTPTASPNWSNTKEHPADDDTTTVTAATVGQKDLYNLDDLPPGFTAQIKGVQAGWCVKKTDAGGAAMVGVWKSGTTEINQSHGVNVIGGNYYPSYASYIYNLQAERQSIFTSSDWTMAEINALQLGMKRTI